LYRNSEFAPRQTLTVSSCQCVLALTTHKSSSLKRKASLCIERNEGLGDLDSFEIDFCPKEMRHAVHYLSHVK